MLEEYRVEKKEQSLEEIVRVMELEEDIYRLVTLTIESGFYYDSKNKLVITKSKREVVREINESLEEYCKLKGIDKELATQIARKAIRNNNELRFNPIERKMAMDLLGIEDDDGQR